MSQPESETSASQGIDLRRCLAIMLEQQIEIERLRAAVTQAHTALKLVTFRRRNSDLYDTAVAALQSALAASPPPVEGKS